MYLFNVTQDATSLATYRFWLCSPLSHLLSSDKVSICGDQKLHQTAGSFIKDPLVSFVGAQTCFAARSEQPVVFVSLLAFEPLRLPVGGWLVSGLYGGSRDLLLHSTGGFMLHWRPGRHWLLCS